MSFLSTLFQIIQEFKALLIALVILCIIKFIRKQKGKQIDENDDEEMDKRIDEIVSWIDEDPTPGRGEVMSRLAKLNV